MKQVSSERQVKHGISQSEGEALRLGREGAWQAESRGGSAPWSAPSVFQGALLLHSLQPNFPVLNSHFKTCIALLSKPEVSFSSNYIYITPHPTPPPQSRARRHHLHRPVTFTASFLCLCKSSLHLRPFTKRWRYCFVLFFSGADFSCFLCLTFVAPCRKCVASTRHAAPLLSRLSQPRRQSNFYNFSENQWQEAARVAPLLENELHEVE